VSEYAGSLPLIHIDLYRTGSEEELELLGLREKLHGNGLAVIEWGEKAATFVPDSSIWVRIVVRPDGKRHITITGTDL
jgi:tRNA threonylcarbamoyladenosine biosynthesis protein TsaE